MKQQQRPVNLNLFTLRLPIPGLVSILHRISGIFLFLAIPFLLWLANRSLESYTSFTLLTTHLNGPFCKLLFFVTVVAFIYHLTAGIRHIVMDLGWGESLAAGRFSAIVVLVINVVLTIGVAIRLW